jgi:Flp pilus assembly protein TadG
MHLTSREHDFGAFAERPAPRTAGCLRGAVRSLGRFVDDQSGSYAILVALLMPVLIGGAALGTEVGLWLYDRDSLQNAADSGAVSGAVAYYGGENDSAIQTETTGIAATYGIVANVAQGITITVNRPPKSGNYTTTGGAVEVIIQRPQARFFTSYWFSGSFNIAARAVAVASGGEGCTLSLDKTAAAATKVQGNAKINLIGCDLYDNSSNPGALSVTGSASVSAQAVDIVGGSLNGTTGITTQQGIYTGASPATDPYANVTVPKFSGCTQTNYSDNSKNPVTINPGVYCGGISLNANANVTLNPGVYYLDQGSLSVNGGATLTGTGVTLVFTSSTGSNYATATINGGATVNLTPPTSGATQGIVMFGDRNMPIGTSFKFNGGASQTLSGAIYIPQGAIDFAGGANTATGCTQIIGDTLNFTGNTNLSINCSAFKTKPLGTAAAKLVE